MRTMMNNQQQHIIEAIPLIPIEWMAGLMEIISSSCIQYRQRPHQRHHSAYNYIQLVREDGFFHIISKWKRKCYETVKFQSINIITNFLHSFLPYPTICGTWDSITAFGDITLCTSASPYALFSVPSCAYSRTFHSPNTAANCVWRSELRRDQRDTCTQELMPHSTATTVLTGSIVGQQPEYCGQTTDRRHY